MSEMDSGDKEAVEVTDLRSMVRSFPLEKLRKRLRGMSAMSESTGTGPANAPVALRLQSRREPRAASPRLSTNSDSGGAGADEFDEDRDKLSGKWRRLKKAVFGFPIPYDAEGKAQALYPWRFDSHHVLNFWMACVAFFTANLSMYCIPALMPAIRDDLNLTNPQIIQSGIVAQIGNVVGRVMSGVALVNAGPRWTNGVNMLLPSMAFLWLALVRNYQGFLAARFFISMLQATFIGNQAWIALLFSSNCVGFATGLGSGIGLAGSAYATLIYGRMFKRMVLHTVTYRAWRWLLFIPWTFCTVAGLIIMQFSTDGDVKSTEPAIMFWRSALMAFFNYRTFVVTLCHGFSIGTLFAMMDRLQGYLTDTFAVELIRAQTMLAGCMFLFYIRPLSGYVSDKLGFRIGFPGRIWSAVIPQILGGIMLIILANSSTDLHKSVAVAALSFLFLAWSAAGTVILSLYISYRSVAPVIGLMGAGGAAGSAISTALAYGGTNTLQEGFKITGALTILAAFPLLVIYFPMWGAPFLRRIGTSTEEEFFLADYSVPEIRKGYAARALRFAGESRSQRGASRFAGYERDLTEALEKARLEKMADDDDSSDGEFDEPNDACKGGVAIVTGSNAGIGFETARGLSAAGFITIATARRPDVGQAAVDKILAEDPKRRCVFFPLDIQDSASAEKLAEFVRETYGGLDVLVNNAGFVAKSTTINYQDAKATVEINYGGTKGVTEALLPLMRQDGRIINITSRIGVMRIVPSDTVRRWLSMAWSAKELDQLAAKFLAAVENDTWRQDGWPGNMYAFSKMLQNLYTRALGRQMDDGTSGVTVVSVCPGQVASGPLGEGKSPEEGADTQIWCATAARKRIKQGAFYGERRELSYT